MKFESQLFSNERDFCTTHHFTMWPIVEDMLGDPLEDTRHLVYRTLIFDWYESAERMNPVELYAYMSFQQSGGMLSTADCNGLYSDWEKRSTESLINTLPCSGRPCCWNDVDAFHLQVSLRFPLLSMDRNDFEIKTTTIHSTNTETSAKDQRHGIEWLSMPFDLWSTSSLISGTIHLECIHPNPNPLS